MLVKTPSPSLKEKKEQKRRIKKFVESETRKLYGISAAEELRRIT